MAIKKQTAITQGKGNLLKVISFSYFAVFLGHSLWRSTFYNYSIEVIQLDQTEISWLFSIASIPGIFAFLLGYIAHKVPLHLLTGITLLLLGTGLLVLGIASDNKGLLLGTFMLSMGFAWYLPLAHNVCIRERSHRSVNRALGRLKSLGPFAAALTAILIYFFNHNHQIEPLFIISGISLLFVGLVVGKSLRNSHYRRKRTALHFSPGLWSFYLLNFISGSRSALFKAFIMTQFVSAFQMSIVSMSLLLLAGNITGIFGYRLLGALADKFNPINILTILYIIIAAVFGGFSYALMQAPSQGIMLAMILFLIDSLLFGSAVITDAYLKQADRSAYIVSDLATGMTFFHLAGFLLPIVGNLIWDKFGINGVLTLGACISISGAISSRFMLALARQPTIHPRKIS
ncbi:MFS transporter [Methyloprofundus sp.]|uniref:MFS transporter n=1 Tax=Methyloprofundus sp. TaxID=2020875 RepID=UPI003D124439